MSTEDGRLIFYSTEQVTSSNGETGSQVAAARGVGQLGGKQGGLTERIKDFEILQLSPKVASETAYVVVTASSDGSVRIWHLSSSEFSAHDDANGQTMTGKSVATNGNGDAPEDTAESCPRVGQLLGTYQTGNRITCLKAFVMLDPVIAEREVLENGENGEFGGFSSGNDHNE